MTKFFKLRRTFCAMMALALLVGALPALAEDGLSASSYQKAIEEITSSFRWAGTAEAQAAADSIAAQLEAYGYAVERQSFEFTQETKGKQNSTTSENIIAVKPANVNPTGDILIISAHYDSKEPTYRCERRRLRRGAAAGAGAGTARCGYRHGASLRFLLRRGGGSARLRGLC